MSRIKLPETSGRRLFRIVIPAFPSFNIYSDIAKTTTALGPVCVATCASKLENWDVEVIDENNCRSRFCPKDEKGLPDHAILQHDRPADVVGFYGSLTSTVPRLFHLAGFYHSRNIVTIAGGKHVENLPEESLENGIDIVLQGEGEHGIRELLSAFEEGRPLERIDGIVFLRQHPGGSAAVVRTKERELISDFQALPFPDFNLVRYAKIRMYPINRSRGCNMNCEFCAVKDRTRCDTPEHMLAQIKYLVETRGARKFFEVSDHFASNREEAIHFCGLLGEYQEKIGCRLGFTVQTRICDARYPELLEAMKRAGIYNICIGYESPIDEELRSMQKGYLSRDMLEWTRTFHRFGFFIHGMFIFGYPRKETETQAGMHIPLQEKIRRFRSFIRRGKLDTAQVLLTVPLPGTELRRRLHDAGKLFPLDQIGWEYYDGQFPLYQPDDGISPEDLQQGMRKIMSRFYSLSSVWGMVVNILIHFPLIVFPAAFTLLTLRVRYLSRAFLLWKKRFFRNHLLRFGGHIVIRNWVRQFHASNFREKLAGVQRQPILRGGRKSGRMQTDAG